MVPHEHIIAQETVRFETAEVKKAIVLHSTRSVKMISSGVHQYHLLELLALLNSKLERWDDVEGAGTEEYFPGELAGVFPRTFVSARS